MWINQQGVPKLLIILVEKGNTFAYYHIKIAIPGLLKIFINGKSQKLKTFK